MANGGEIMRIADRALADPRVRNPSLQHLLREGGAGANGAKGGVVFNHCFPTAVSDAPIHVLQRYLVREHGQTPDSQWPVCHVLTRVLGEIGLVEIEANPELVDNLLEAQAVQFRRKSAAVTPCAVPEFQARLKRDAIGFLAANCSKDTPAVCHLVRHVLPSDPRQESLRCGWSPSSRDKPRRCRVSKS